MNSIEIQNGINQIYNNDKFLAKIISLTETCSLDQHKKHYLSFLRAIVAQQLSTLAARAIIKRFMNFYNDKPSPEKILNTSDEALRGLGLSWAKAKYVKDLSSKIISKEIHFRGLNKKSDQEIITDFIKVKGVGVWTVHMFLMFTLGRLNVLPINDLGIKKGAMLVYNLRKLPDEKKLISLSKKYSWDPYNSIACWYLWKSLEIKELL